MQHRDFCNFLFGASNWMRWKLIKNGTNDRIVKRDRINLKCQNGSGIEDSIESIKRSNEIATRKKASSWNSYVTAASRTEWMTNGKTRECTFRQFFFSLFPIEKSEDLLVNRKTRTHFHFTLSFCIYFLTHRSSVRFAYIFSSSKMIFSVRSFENSLIRLIGINKASEKTELNHLSVSHFVSMVERG